MFFAHRESLVVRGQWVGALPFRPKIMVLAILLGRELLERFSDCHVFPSGPVFGVPVDPLETLLCEFARMGWQDALVDNLT